MTFQLQPEIRGIETATAGSASFGISAGSCVVPWFGMAVARVELEHRHQLNDAFATAGQPLLHRCTQHFPRDGRGTVTVRLDMVATAAASLGSTLDVGIQ